MPFSIPLPIVAVSDEEAAAESSMGDLMFEGSPKEGKASDGAGATSERMKAAHAANGSRDDVTLMVDFCYSSTCGSHVMRGLRFCVLRRREEKQKCQPWSLLEDRRSSTSTLSDAGMGTPRGKWEK